MHIKKYRVGIFDFDGTIADTRGCIFACVDAAFRRVGLIPPQHSVLAQLVGLPLSEMFHRSSSDSLSASTLEKLQLLYKEEYIQRSAELVSLFPGVHAMLDGLVSRGVTLALATSKSRVGTIESLKILGLTKVFDVAVTSDDVSYGKPHAQTAHKVLDAVAAQSSDALVIGDTTFDVEMAHAAGIDSAAVTWGNHAEDRLRAAHPTLILRTVSEIAPLLIQGDK